MKINSINVNKISNTKNQNNFSNKNSFTSRGFYGRDNRIIEQTLIIFSVIAQADCAINDNKKPSVQKPDESKLQDTEKEDRINYINARLIDARGSYYGPGKMERNNYRVVQLADELSFEQLQALDNKFLDREIYYMGDTEEPLEHLDFVKTLSPENIKTILSDQFSRWYFCNLIEGTYQSIDEAIEAMQKLTENKEI